MRHLMIDGKYLDKLLNGEKTITIRLKKPRLSPGDLAYVHSKGKIRAIIRIKKVYSKKFEELSLEDAIKDGFESLEELKRELQKLYGDLKGKRLRIVEFELVKRMEKEESYGDPIEIAKNALEKIELTPEERKIVEAVLSGGSIRKAAEILYGDPLKRRRIRAVLRRLGRKLRNQENLRNNSSDPEYGQREASQESY